MRLESFLLCLSAVDLAYSAAGCPFSSAKAAIWGSEEAPPIKRYTKAADSKRGVFFHNRIAPLTQTLYIANSDGTNERPFLGEHASNIDYHASFSPDGEWIVFTSERNGDGNADLYRIRSDGTELEELIATPAIEDSGVISPDGNKLAYVSSANGRIANIWVMDLETKETRNLTDTALTKSHPDLPRGNFVSLSEPELACPSPDQTLMF